MIAYVKGSLGAKGPGHAYIEANGLGYEVQMGEGALSRLPDVGEQVMVYTYLQAREDGLALFGFPSLEEKALFLRLIGVSGIGPKIALAALSLYSPAQLTDAVMRQDVAAVQRIPGVGKKTASRIILELKGSLEADLEGPGLLGEAASAEGSPAAAAKAAADALLSMGFSADEVELALKGAPEGGDEAQVVKYALRRLGS